MALLDVLRPPVGWRVDRALLSTYSADPAVLAAVLLALVARDEDSGSGARAALARALIELRGRVAIVVQRGRLAAPATGNLALGLLDRYVREARYAESAVDGLEGRSWHAKLAIVRFQTEDGKTTRWRLWLGSRNLTRISPGTSACRLRGVREGAVRSSPAWKRQRDGSPKLLGRPRRGATSLARSQMSAGRFRLGCVSPGSIYTCRTIEDAECRRCPAG